MLAGVEGGGTKFVAVVGTSPDGIEARLEVPTSTPEATLAPLADFLRAYPVESLGIGCFGPLGLDRTRSDFGRLLGTPKAGWAGTDLVAGLLGQRDLPVGIDTDVNAAALAESHAGPGRPEDLAYMTIGTGIGVGLIVRGEPVHGSLHPEAGHLRVRRSPADDFAGICPFHGDCLEGLASGPAIAARAGRPATELEWEHPIWERVADEVAEALSSLFYVVAPSRVVLGGGVGLRAGLVERVAERLDTHLAGYLPAARFGPAARRVCAAQLGRDAGPRGALLLAQRATSA